MSIAAHLPQRTRTLLLLISATLVAACGGGDDAATAARAGSEAAGTSQAADVAADAPDAQAQSVRRRVTTPAPVVTDTLVIQASGTPADGVWPTMMVRVNRVPLGTVSVGSTLPRDYSFKVGVKAGDDIDVVFMNDALGKQGEDRNLVVHRLATPTMVLLPTTTGAYYDRGTGAEAVDGKDILPAQQTLPWSGALRLKWPAAPDTTQAAARQEAARLLMQTTFGPTATGIDEVLRLGTVGWLEQQLAQPFQASYVPEVQALYARGAAFRPDGAQYDPGVVGRTFWRTAYQAPDQLRRRVGFALHQIFMVSQSDSNLWPHARAFAQYMDQLNQHAFGNYRVLIEEMALSPAMGIYLSHMRNRKEDPLTGRLPDENFARELMQLFTIGLHELNMDGSPRLDGNGQPIETYGNADVMALAKVFTGWSWALPNAQLNEAGFRWGNPDLRALGDGAVDLQRMRAYPGMHSPSEKRLFAGKPHELVIPAGTPPADALRMALDSLFMHPNVGPFVGRQLIQRLVTSHPSPGYVQRVASVFNDNGRGVRGDLRAVVRAIVLDPEARASAPAPTFGKLREPVLRVAHWMRAFEAQSKTGRFALEYAFDEVGQRALYAHSVFGYTRPGYVPPNTSFSSRSATAPEMQIVNEATVAAWMNTALAMSEYGIGWSGSGPDITGRYDWLARVMAAGQLSTAVDQLNLVMLAGRMSEGLRRQVYDAVRSVAGNDAASHQNRAKLAVLLVLSSPEYLLQQ